MRAARVATGADTSGNLIGVILRERPGGNRAAIPGV